MWLKRGAGFTMLKILRSRLLIPIFLLILLLHFTWKFIYFNEKDKVAFTVFEKRDFVDDKPFLSPVSHTYLYSAYWDERKNSFDNPSGSTPKIRIFGAARHARLPYLYCIFRTNCSWFSSKITFKSVLDQHGKEYFGYTMSCAVPKNLKYKPGMSVEISGSSDSVCDAVKMELKQVSNRKRNKLKFGICVPPLFGNIEEDRLIEFVELSQILGAEKITFYLTKNVTENIENILQYYKIKGLVDILSWNLPEVLSEKNKKIWYNGQDITVQDCLYRNMIDIKYISCNDIDEFIIPHKFNNWSHLIKNYDKSSKISDFRFTSAFFKVKGEDIPLNGRPNIEVFTKRVKFMPERSKCIVKPEHVFDMGTHNMNRQLLMKTKTVWVDSSDAYLHHYRPCEKNCGPQVEDSYAKKYADEVYQKITLVKKEMGSNLYKP